jgi:hypothetical protein
MANSFFGGAKRSVNSQASEPLPDASGAFLHTVPLPMIVEEDDEPAPVVDLLKLSPEQRFAQAMAIIERHHARVAKTLQAMWGYQECSDYISKLIMSGVDGTGKARVGFNQDAASAMLVLGNLHDEQFGAAKSAQGLGFDPNSGFSDSKFHASWDTSR